LQPGLLHFIAQPVEVVLGGSHRFGVVLFLAQLDQADAILQPGLEGAVAIQRRGKPVPFAHQFLRVVRIVPKVGIFGEGVQFGKAFVGVIPVKDASAG